jgi:sugar lactone lactonase YvrE
MSIHSVVPLIALVTVMSACTEKPTETDPAVPTDTSGAAKNITTPKSAKVEKWVTGAKIMGANGLYFSPDDTLYAASVVSSAIMTIDTADGTISALPEETAKLVVTPDDLAFNKHGTMCWTDITQGKVGCMEPDGSASIAATLSPGNNPITFSDDGRLFVGQCFFGHELYEVYLDSDKPPRLITDKLQDETQKNLPCGFNGMDLGPDGKLYGPRWFKHEVTQLNVDSGEFETYLTGFDAPASVKFDAQGVMHVLDSGAGRIYRI